MSEKHSEYDLYREAAGMDDEPYLIDTFSTRDEAKAVLRRRAVAADLLFSDYEIEEQITEGGEE